MKTEVFMINNFETTPLFKYLHFLKQICIKISLSTFICESEKNN
jgi:hypothetical protein